MHLKISFSLWGKGERTKNGEEMAYMCERIKIFLYGTRDMKLL
jgi:hypothetical protein